MFRQLADKPRRKMNQQDVPQCNVPRVRAKGAAWGNMALIDFSQKVEGLMQLNKKQPIKQNCSLPLSNECEMEILFKCS